METVLPHREPDTEVTDLINAFEDASTPEDRRLHLRAVLRRLEHDLAKALDAALDAHAGLDFLTTIASAEKAGAQ